MTSACFSLPSEQCQSCPPVLSHTTTSSRVACVSPGPREKPGWTGEPKCMWSTCPRGALWGAEFTQNLDIHHFPSALQMLSQVPPLKSINCTSQISHLGAWPPPWTHVTLTLEPSWHPQATPRLYQLWFQRCNKEVHTSCRHVSIHSL